MTELMNYFYYFDKHYNHINSKYYSYLKKDDKEILAVNVA